MTILTTKKPTPPMPPLAYDNAYVVRGKCDDTLSLAILNPSDAGKVIIIRDDCVRWTHSSDLYSSFDIVACVSMSEIDINVPVDPV